jgi:hypothetical protein
LSIERDRYVRSGRKSIGGWFSVTDAWMFVASDDAQRDESGDLLEIGAYLGRSAALLGYLARDGVEVVVVDLFEEAAATTEQAAEQARFYEGLARQTFLANYGRFHEQAPKVLQGRSDEMLPEVADGSVRLVHVDGSHTYEVVVGDIVEACRVASPNAILIFDDIITHHTPGVAAAVWGSVLDGRVVPLAQTNAKLYATVPGSAITAERLAAAIDPLPLKVVESHTVAGWPVLEVLSPQAVSPPLWRRALTKLRYGGG